MHPQVFVNPPRAPRVAPISAPQPSCILGPWVFNLPPPPLGPPRIHRLGQKKKRRERNQHVRTPRALCCPLPPQRSNNQGPSPSTDPADSDSNKLPTRRGARPRRTDVPRRRGRGGESKKRLSPYFSTVHCWRSPNISYLILDIHVLKRGGLERH